MDNFFSLILEILKVLLALLFPALILYLIKKGGDKNGTNKPTNKAT